MLLFVNNLIAIALGFGAGVLWLGRRDKKQMMQYEIECVTAEEYDRVLAGRTRAGYKLYEISVKAEEYAAHKHTVYRKVARELNTILDA